MLVNEVVSIFQRVEDSREVSSLCDWAIHAYTGGPRCTGERTCATSRPAGEAIANVRCRRNVYALAAVEKPTRPTHCAPCAGNHRQEVLGGEICRVGGVTAGSHRVADCASIAPIAPYVLRACASLWRCSADRMRRARRPR